MNANELAARLEVLSKVDTGEAWQIVQEPHFFPDGTTHFTHVSYWSKEVGVGVSVAQHVDPELAELLCLLHNNLELIIAALKCQADN